MEQKKMNVKKAAFFIDDVKEAIMNVVKKHNIVISYGCVDERLSTMMMHTDEVDIGGDYGCVELRVYWEDEDK